jgi:hypothetical protein
MQGAAVEQGRRGAHEIEARDQVVERDGPGLPVDLAEGQSHCHTHEEDLRQLDAPSVDVQEVAVVEGLKAQVAKESIPLGSDRGGETIQIELGKARVEQFGLDSLTDKFGEVGHIGSPHLIGGNWPVQHLVHQSAQQQARGGVIVARVGLDEAAGREDQGLTDFLDRDAVVQIAQGVLENQVCGYAFFQPDAGRFTLGSERREIKRAPYSVGDHVQRGDLGGGHDQGSALGGPALPVQDIGARHIVLARAHQGQLHLILDVFDMYAAPVGQATGQGAHHHIGKPCHHLSHAGRAGALATLHGQKGLGHCHRYFFCIERNNRCIAADDLEGSELRLGARIER